MSGHLAGDAATPLSDAELGALHAVALEDTCIMPVPADAGPPPELKVRGRKADRRFTYRDADGNLLGHNLRWEARDGRRKEFRPQTFWSNGNGQSGWKTRAWPSKRPLFRLDQLAKNPGAVVLLVEGEKKVEAISNGPLAEAIMWAPTKMVGVTWPGGCEALKHIDFTPLANRDVIIIPDADDAGEKSADTLVDILQQVGVRRLRRWKAPPVAREAWDIADEVPPGWEPEEIVKSMLDAPVIVTPRIVQTLPEFLASFEPPDYLIDGLLQRHYFYAITAKTAAGKTAVALLISALVANPKVGQKLGPHDVEHGRVIYVTRENPTDVRMRLIGMAAKMGFEPADLARTFLVIDSVDNLEKDMERIRREVATFGEVVLVILDTSVALFQGDDENDAKQMLDHAHTQRKLCDLPGRPTVIALCHPPKAANSPEQLLPRGGGSYLNELDGNLTLWAHDDRLTDLYWTGKLRGADFQKITFRLPTIMTTQLMDKKGRVLPTVMAEIVTDAEIAEVEEKSSFQETRLMRSMLDKPDASLAEWARACGWMLAGKGGHPGQLNKALVQRVLGRLLKDKLIAKEGRKYALNKHGKAAVSAAK
jgi:hypothetical protein